MTFPQAIRQSLQRYAVFSGRASRAEFWWFQLFNLLGTFATGLLDEMMSGGGMALFSSIWALGMFLPSISVLVRRLHDIDRTGWWFWIILLPMIGMIVLLVFTLIRGSEGSNGYGPPSAANPTQRPNSEARGPDGLRRPVPAAERMPDEAAAQSAHQSAARDAALSRSRIPVVPRDDGSDRSDQ